MDDASSDVDEQRASANKFGPGVIVLVVGPSGVGKDALLQGAAARLQCDPTIVFPKRIVSRPEHPAEDHDRATRAEMNAAAQHGAYALSWQAHGAIYGIPVQIDDAVEAGSKIVFNASRTVVGAARDRYGNVRVIYVDAAKEIRAERLAQRGRETEVEILDRLSREVTSFLPADADVTVNNDGTLGAGVAELVAAIQQSVSLET